ncbi:MAG: ribonuclease R [Erysipelotrichaceae bacterium]|nr:ribonuclease R [Erysipelotrichaceae bacterium]
MKEKIVELIKAEGYQGMTIQQLASHFQKEDSTSFKEFVRLCNALEEERVLARDTQQKYYLSSHLGYFEGVLRMNEKGFGFVENENESVYVHETNVNQGLNNDLVYARKWTNKDSSVECEIVNVIEHRMKTIVGTIKIKAQKTYFLADQSILQKPIKITNMKEYALVNDHKVLLHIDRYGKVLHCHIEKVLGHKYDPGIDILSILYDHDIIPEFPSDVLEEANQISHTIAKEDEEGRVDLRDKTIITIDGEDAKDLDDAISVEKIDGGFRLGVHIADVSHYIKENTALDREAYARGTSVYVVDRVVPMLPHALSNGICSLHPHVDRLTLTCMMDIDMQGEIQNYQLFPSIIKTTERMTYTKVNAILAKNKEVTKDYIHILALCKNMKQLSQIIRKRREALGAIDFDAKEAKIIVDKKGYPKDIVIRDRGESERIIEDFMICANECVAAHVRWLETPSIYRIHESPEPKKIREFAGFAKMLGYAFRGGIQDVHPRQLQKMLEEAKGTQEYSILSSHMLRSMQKARYDRKCLGHFGLGLENYTHFTSPIRRYPDLIVHRMLRKYCFQNMHDIAQIERDEQWIEECALHTSKQERKAIDAERAVEDMKKAQYMERYVGCVFEGMVSGVTKFGIFVELENTVEGLVHIKELRDDYYHYDEMSRTLIGERTARVYKMGQKVKIRVMDANRYKRQIDFRIVK